MSLCLQSQELLFRHQRNNGFLPLFDKRWFNKIRTGLAYFGKSASDRHEYPLNCSTFLYPSFWLLLIVIGSLSLIAKQEYRWEYFVDPVVFVNSPLNFWHFLNEDCSKQIKAWNHWETIRIKVEPAFSSVNSTAEEALETGSTSVWGRIKILQPSTFAI